MSFWTSALTAGYSVTPISQAILDGWVDGSKNYTYKWRTYQSESMPADVAAKEFAGVPGMATICGSASGGLLVIDIDVPSYYELFLDLLRKNWPRLNFPAVVRTPSGGYHLYIRMKGGEVPPNQKLAHDVDGDSGEIQIAIETRGQGGLVYAPPTPGYEWLLGGLDKVPVWDAERVAQILMMARTLDMAPERTVPEAMPHDKPRKAGEGDRPGDVANTELVWRDLLERDGWLHLYDHGGRGYYRRPGKDGKQVGGVTGLGRGGQDLLYVFSTNAPVPEGLHSKFHYIAITKHGGDYGAATKALADQLGVIRFRPEVERTVAEVTTEPSQQRPAEDKTYALTDVGNAERMFDICGESFRWIPEWKKFALWDGKRWDVQSSSAEPVTWHAIETVRRMYAQASDLPTAGARTALAEWAMKCESASRISNMVNLVKAVPGCSISSEKFDTNLNLLNAANGTIDLRTGELRGHRREDWISLVMDTEYDPEYQSQVYFDAGMAVFDGDGAMFKYFLTALGYALTGSLREECLFFLYGSGANGKGTLMNTARDAIGPYGGTIGEDTLMARRGMSDQDTTGLVRMRGKRIVTVTEVEEGTRWNEKLLKSATGRDPIEVRELYVGRYSYNPTWTMFVYGNHKPSVRGADDGFWRRMRLIPFEKQFMGADKDDTLKDRLLEPRELSGVLGLIVNGCLHYQKDGMVTPGKVNTATKEYRADMDTLGGFIDECLQESTYGLVLAKDVYNTYKIWAKQNGYTYTMHNRQFIGSLRDRGINGKKTMHGVAFEGYDLSASAPKSWGGSSEGGL